MDERLIELQNSYDEVAEEYVARIFHELEHKNILRAPITMEKIPP